MTAALREVHWPPVTHRIQFQLLTLMPSAVHATSPRYLDDHVTAYVPYRSLRSADQTLVVVPRINLECFVDELFHAHDTHFGTGFHYIT